MTLERCLTITRKSCCYCKDRASHSRLLYVTSVQRSLGKSHGKASQRPDKVKHARLHPRKGKFQENASLKKKKSKKSEWGMWGGQSLSICALHPYLCKVTSTWQRLSLLRGPASSALCGLSVSKYTRDSRAHQNGRQFRRCSSSPGRSHALLLHQSFADTRRQSSPKWTMESSTEKTG